MRVKRSEYEILKNIISNHTKRFRVIDINKQLEEYCLYGDNIYGDYLRILDYDGSYVVLIVLSEFETRFDQYKKLLKDGYIFTEEIIEEPTVSNKHKRHKNNKVLKPNKNK